MPDHDDAGEDETNDPGNSCATGRKRPVLIRENLFRIEDCLKIRKQMKFPKALRLKLGYDVPRGNPIKSYQELDFDVSKSPISIESSRSLFYKKGKK